MILCHIQDILRWDSYLSAEMESAYSTLQPIGLAMIGHSVRIKLIQLINRFAITLSDVCYGFIYNCQASCTHKNLALRQTKLIKHLLLIFSFFFSILTY